MKKTTAMMILMIPVVFVLGRLSAQEGILASCVMCSADHVPAEELARYERIGREQGLTDQQVRSIDIGKTNMQVALAHRGKLESRAGQVAEHDLVTEVYYVVSGGGTVLTGPDLVDPRRRPADNRAVMTLNGPGHNAADVRNGEVHELKPGDVLVIPAGTGHEFTRIDDHITYVMVRIDPDKVVPLMSAEDSVAYLAGLER